jgi:hypothetical protein
MELMIDLETLSHLPNGIPFQLGAVVFDETGIKGSFYREIDPVSCEEIGLQMSVKTVIWWLEKESDSFNLKTRYGIQNSLHDFLAWLYPYFLKERYAIEPIITWANSPRFDLAILEKCFDAFEMAYPWNYSTQRDFRTLKAIDMRFYKPRNTHNALSDATSQAEYVIKFYQDRSVSKKADIVVAENIDIDYSQAEGVVDKDTIDPGYSPVCSKDVKRNGMVGIK